MNAEVSLRSSPSISVQALTPLEPVESRTRAGLQVACIMAWKTQAQLASLAPVLLLAFVSTWVAAIAMIAWSMTAAVIYCHVRRRGFPDLITTGRRRKSSSSLVGHLTHGFFTACTAWLVGIQALVFTRLFGPVLGLPVDGYKSRASHRLILAVAMVLFGVVTAHHLLQKAGYEEDDVLRYTLASSALNVVYRLLFTSMLLNIFLSISTYWGLFDRIKPF